MARRMDFLIYEQRLEETLTKKFSRSTPRLIAHQDAEETVLMSRSMATGMLRKNAAGTQGGVILLQGNQAHTKYTSTFMSIAVCELRYCNHI